MTAVAISMKWLVAPMSLWVWPMQWMMQQAISVRHWAADDLLMDEGRNYVERGCGIIGIYTAWATVVCDLGACSGSHDMVVCILFCGLCWFLVGRAYFQFGDAYNNGFYVNGWFFSRICSHYVALMRFLQVSRVFAWYG